MTYKLPELKAMLKENKIKGWSHCNKPQLLELLREKKYLPPMVEQVDEFQQEVNIGHIIKEIDSRYEYLRGIRNSPKSVEITDNDTGKTTMYPSIYKAAQALKISPRLITFHNGRTFKNIYLIKVLKHNV